MPSRAMIVRAMGSAPSLAVLCSWICRLHEFHQALHVRSMHERTMASRTQLTSVLSTIGTIREQCLGNPA